MTTPAKGPNENASEKAQGPKDPVGNGEVPPGLERRDPPGPKPRKERSETAAPIATQAPDLSAPALGGVSEEIRPLTVPTPSDDEIRAQLEATPGMIYVAHGGTRVYILREEGELHSIKGDFVNMTNAEITEFVRQYLDPNNNAL